MAGQDVQIKIGAIDQTKAAFNSVSRSLNGLKSSIFSVQSAVISLGGALVGKTILDANRSFQQLEASLVTFTGSTQKAAEVFAVLQDFASRTPFALEEVVGGFNKLVARGINPSIDSLTAFGNIASGTGKSLDQFVEALADAATGEFERLKEFGIKASKEGERITFTFGGIKTTVANTSTEILGYLEQLAKTKFAGATERQFDTLNGAISNLNDNIFKASVTLGKTFNDEIVKLIKTLGNVILKFGEFIASTQEIGRQTSVFARMGDALLFIAEMSGNVRFAIQAIGETLGGVAAIIAYALKGDFESAKAVFEGIGLMIQLRKKELDDFKESLRKVSDEVAKPMGDTSTPLLGGDGGAAAAAAEAARLRFEAQADNIIEGIDNQFKALYAANKKAKDALAKDVATLFEETRTPIEKLNIEMARLQKMVNDGVITWDVYSRAVMQANEEFEAMQVKMPQTPLQEFRSSIKTVTEELQNMAVRGLQNLEDNLTAVVMGTKSAKDAFSDMARSIISDLIRIQIRKSIVEPLSGYLDTAIGAITGTRAMGGSVTAGKSYLVGEQGAELFVPGQTGTIVPNNKMSADGVTVVQNINVTTGVQQTVRAEIMTLMPQIANAAKSAVADAKLRGGSYAAALR